MIPKDVLERLSTFKLPSFWADSTVTTRWVAVGIGVSSGPSEDWPRAAPVGTWIAAVDDLGLVAEAKSADEAVLGMTKLIESYIAENGAEIPYDSYVKTPGDSFLGLTTKAWIESLNTRERLGRFVFSWRTAIRVGGVTTLPSGKGPYRVEPVGKDEAA